MFIRFCNFIVQVQFLLKKIYIYILNVMAFSFYFHFQYQILQILFNFYTAGNLRVGYRVIVKFIIFNQLDVMLLSR